MNTNTNKNQIAEQWLDAAAGEALGANSPTESAAYQLALTAAGPAEKRADRDLKETAATLSAASPYMQPPESLRGKILQATAPAAFRMEDYRKANRDSNRFYRWGFYAAMLCLMAGAWYNLSIKSALTATQSELSAARLQAGERNTALEAFVNPHADQITFQENGKVVGKAIVDQKAKTAVVILPPGMVPAGKIPQSTITHKDPVSHEDVVASYKTVLLIAPANALDMPTGKSIDSMLAIKNMTPDPHQPQIAGK